MKYIDFNQLIHATSLMVVVIVLGIIGCGDKEDGIYNRQERNTPRVIAVEPKPGSKPTEAVELTLRQEISITFNEPIIPNSGRIMIGSQFGSRSAIQLQDTDATDAITWNICFRQLGLEPDTLVVSDFQNVNGDVQPHAFVGWYWMSLYDIGPPRIIDYYPTGHEVDPKTTRFIRLVFEKPMGEVFCEITPAITLNPARIENDSIKSCTGIVTWEFADTEQLDYSTQYDVKIEGEDLALNFTFGNFSFTTRASPF
ncbi:MAG: Ig-like domain-containing protein [Candidatus Poribacteria bacterium]|nr:Ig-like domain-containing protein [Candidatus Poribacteria bacterium]